MWCVPLDTARCVRAVMCRSPQLSSCTNIEVSLKNLGTVASLGHSWCYYCWWERHSLHCCSGANPSLGGCCSLRSVFFCS